MVADRVVGRGGGGGGGRDGEGGRTKFNARSRVAIDCLLLGGFGVALSSDRSKVLEGEAPTQARAWLREPLLGKGKEHLRHVLDSLSQYCAAVCGVGVPASSSNSRSISSRMWAQRRALEVNEVVQMGHLKFFIFFNIGGERGEAVGEG